MDRAELVKHIKVLNATTIMGDAVSKDKFLAAAQAALDATDARDALNEVVLLAEPILYGDGDPLKIEKAIQAARDAGHLVEKCPDCGGRGERFVRVYGPGDYYPCPTCNGTGEKVQG